MPYYTFRVDELEGVTRSRVKSFLDGGDCGTHCVVFEISEKTAKPHYQGWVHTDLGEQTWRSRIKKAFPECVSKRKGRSSGKYSTSPVKDMETYMLYCMKGTAVDLPDIVSMQAAVGEEIDVAAMHRQYWSHPKHTSTSEKKYHVLEEAIQYFTSHMWRNGIDEYEKRELVVGWFMRRCVEKNKGINSFLIRSYSNTVIASLDPDSYQFICKEIASRV